MQMWFNGRMSASQAEHAGSIPVICSKAPRTIVFGAYLLPLDFYLGLSLELWKVISNSEK